MTQSLWNKTVTFSLFFWKRPVTKIQRNLVIPSLKYYCECWFPLFFYDSARRRAWISREHGSTCGLFGRVLIFPEVVQLSVTFSEPFVWHELKHDFRQRHSQLATLSLTQRLVQAHERPPKFLFLNKPGSTRGVVWTVPSSTSGHLQRADRACRPRAEAKDFCKGAYFPESAPELFLGCNTPDLSDLQAHFPGATG